MHRLLFQRLASSNVSKNLTNNTNSSLLHSHTYKTFTSLTKSTLPNYQYRNHIVSSCPQINPIRHFLSSQSHHTLSGKIPGFISNPLLSKKKLSSLSSTHFTISSKSLKDCKVGFLRAGFARWYSGFNGRFPFRGPGRRSWFNRLSADDVVLGLILTNVAVFMLWRIADGKFMVDNFMISLDNFKSGRVHTLITSAFSHMDLEHIISNMIGLYFFGTDIGRALGPEYLLKLYLAGAIGGSVFYLVHHAFLALSSKGQGMFVKDPSRTPGLGASGAVNAVMLLNIFLNPRSTIYLQFFIPVPAMLLGIFLIGKDILRIIEGNSNISGSAHLGGAAVAAIAWARIRKGRRF